MLKHVLCLYISLLVFFFLARSSHAVVPCAENFFQQRKNKNKKIPRKVCLNRTEGEKVIFHQEELSSCTWFSRNKVKWFMEKFSQIKLCSSLGLINSRRNKKE